ncbi:MAG: hypothetical protein JEZ02_09505 [Desulfatibacillum sp.]|nr:hypothetical protein [Desulfatibacillum sp.]
MKNTKAAGKNSHERKGAYPGTQTGAQFKITGTAQGHAIPFTKTPVVFQEKILIIWPQPALHPI